jgi:hypothetical protein
MGVAPSSTRRDRKIVASVRTFGQTAQTYAQWPREVKHSTVLVSGVHDLSAPESK